jgi:hypothetical protein
MELTKGPKQPGRKMGMELAHPYFPSETWVILVPPTELLSENAVVNVIYSEGLKGGYLVFIDARLAG